MNVMGIDLGSRSVKIVISNQTGIIYKNIIDTSAFYKNHCKNVGGKIHLNPKGLNIDKYKIAMTISTGYGRNNVNIDGSKVIVELKAHTIGALNQTGLNDFTLLDIGGQDCKVISVKNGKMADMILNDKCAASCGRYIENMCNILGISQNETSGYFENPVELSSTCAVFGESELIGKISEGHDVSILAAGINYSLFKRIKPLVEKFQGETLVVSGGVAQNKALIHFIENELNFKQIIIPNEPQLNGAIGCSIYGKDLIQ